MAAPFLIGSVTEPPATTWFVPGEADSVAANMASVVGKIAKVVPIAPNIAMAGLDAARNPQPYVEMFRHAERVERLTGNIVSEAAAREEAYDKRIAQVKSLTGVELENPERGGYWRDAKAALLEESRSGGLDPTSIDAAMIADRQRRAFDQKLDEVRQKHPDRGPDLTFGDINAEGRALAGEAGKAKAPDVDNPLAGFGMQMAGGMWGQRRDPLFTGSLFFGPTTAAGKTALGRVFSSAFRQGFFNLGLRAVEQPVVQDWRAQIGLESGILPAIEDVGMAFVTGAVMGGGFRALHEASPIKRVLEGRPEKGDLESAERLGGAKIAPEDMATLRAGEEALLADRAVLTEPPAKGVSRESHDSLQAAALRRADDPDAPSPQAVAAVDNPTPEIKERIDAAQPRTLQEAQQAADEALDDIGRRNGIAATQEALSRPVHEPVPPLPEGEKPQPTGRPRGDVLDKLPFVDDKGNHDFVTSRTLAKAGEKESTWAMLVRSCK